MENPKFTLSEPYVPSYGPKFFVSETIKCQLEWEMDELLVDSSWLYSRNRVTLRLREFTLFYGDSLGMFHLGVYTEKIINKATHICLLLCHSCMTPPFCPSMTSVRWCASFLYHPCSPIWHHIFFLMYNLKLNLNGINMFRNSI